MSSVSLQQALAEAHAHHQRGDLAQAERGYAKILTTHPRNADALALLGALYLQRGDAESAVQRLGEALRRRPAFPQARFNLAQAHLALARVHHKNGRRAEAIEHLEASLALEPNAADHRVTLMKFYREADDLDGMLRTADAGLALNPAAAELHIGRSEVLFERGSLAEAWQEWDWRFDTAQIPVPRKQFPFPTWQGEPLAGKSLFVWREQGVGDEIMYASMFGELVASAGRCVIECNARLLPVFARAYPGAEFVVEGSRPKTGEAFDYHIALGSLGRWLRRDFAAFPRRDRYLSADVQQTAALRATYSAGLGQPFLVGVAWRSAGVEFAANKSAGLNVWGPIFGLPGVRFVNIQYGDCGAEIAAARKAFGVDIVEDATIDPLKDLDAAAAQIAALDLVITTSNTAAHLAGALGVPTLCLLPKALGSGRRWYWFTRRPQCPWYASVRRIVQMQDGDWAPPVADAALAALDAAVAKGAIAKPLNYLLGLAKAYTASGQFEFADKVLAQADRVAPGTPILLYEWARTKKRLGQHEHELAKIDAALAIKPNEVEFLNARGMALMNLNRPEDAVASYTAALQLAPSSSQVHNNFGTALRVLGRPAEALAHHQAALEGMADHPGILFNIGGIYNEGGEIEKAIATYDRVLAIDPAHIDAHFNRGQSLLRGGRFIEGWPEYAWRLRRPPATVRPEYFPAPVWAGQPLDGRKVLIWTDQGLGDEIMVASLLPDAVARARQVILMCSPRLVALMRRSFPTVIVEAYQSPLPAAARATDIDFQMSLSELGLVLRRDFADFPQRRGFLTADPKLRARLRAKYEALAPGSRIVGISWKSPANPEVGRLKAVDLAGWLPILKQPGLTFVNLQYGDTAEDLGALEAAHGVKVFSDPEVNPLGDMDPAAAQIAAMDLVISTSNTAVHLAGGLGVPTFVLLTANRGRHWYWFVDRTDSPWYPSLTLYPAREAGRWDEAIARVAADVEKLRA